MPRITTKADVSWYIKGRKRPIAHSTIVTLDVFEYLAKECNGDVEEMMKVARYSHDVRELCEIFLKYGVTNIYED